MENPAQGDPIDLAAKAVADLADNDTPLAKALVALAQAVGIQASASAASAAAVVDMAKARDDDDDSDDDDDDTSDEDGDDDTDEKPGFKDMGKGDPDGTLDVTADVAELQKAVADANAKIDDLSAMLSTIVEQQGLLASMVKGTYSRNEELAKASATATIEMVKALGEQKDALSRVASPSLTPRVTPKVPRDAAPVNVDDPPPNDFIGGNPSIEGLALVKATMAGKLTREQATRFHAERRFADDEAINTQLRTAVAVFAT